MKTNNSNPFKVDHFTIALKLATEIDQWTSNIKDIDKIIQFTKQILSQSKVG